MARVHTLALGAMQMRFEPAADVLLGEPAGVRVSKSKLHDHCAGLAGRSLSDAGRRGQRYEALDDGATSHLLTDVFRFPHFSRPADKARPPAPPSRKTDGRCAKRAAKRPDLRGAELRKTDGQRETGEKLAQNARKTHRGPRNGTLDGVAKPNARPVSETDTDLLGNGQKWGETTRKGPSVTCTSVHVTPDVTPMLRAKRNNGGHLGRAERGRNSVTRVFGALRFTSCVGVRLRAYEGVHFHVTLLRLGVSR